MSSYYRQDAKLWEIVKIGRSKYKAIGRDPKGVMLWKGSGPTIYHLIEGAQGEWGLGRYDNRPFAHPIAQQFSRLSENIRRYVREQQRQGSAITPGGIRKNIFTFNNPGSAQRVLAENFVKGANSGVASSMYIHGNRIYSYGPHFPIAERHTISTTPLAGTPVIIITNRKSPSKTTSGQIGLVKAAAQQAGMEIMYEELKPEAKGPAAYSNPQGAHGFFVWGKYNSVGWYPTRDEAERVATQMNYRGGTHYTVRPAGAIGVRDRVPPARRGVRENIFTFNNPRGRQFAGAYQVIVGNIGCVYSGNSKSEAERTYSEYVRQSKAGYGRADGEPVTLMLHDEIVREHEGNLPRENVHAIFNPKDTQVEAACREAGLLVATWSPGDGTTRYRFFVGKVGQGRGPWADYHQGDGIYTALGRKDALSFIVAYKMGRNTRRNPLTQKETQQVVEGARFSARMARSVSPGKPYRSHLLGVAEGKLHVAAQYGRGKARARASIAESAIDRMAIPGGPYMRFSHKPIHRNPAACPNPCVRGDKLPYHLQQEVLRKYIYRWTSGNTQRESAWAGISGKPRIPLITDAQWLREHAFHVTKKGELDLRHHHAEPYYMADDWKKGDPRPNPLLQTVLAANPPSSADKSKRMMVALLKKQFKGLVDWDTADTEFNVEGAIYWFANDYHGGQGTDLYSILSTSEFRPGPSVRGPEEGIEQLMYDALVQEYGRNRHTRRNPYVVIDRPSGRVSSVERGKDLGAAARAYEFASDVSSYMGRPQDVRRVSRATKIRTGDFIRRPVGANPKKPMYLIEGNRIPYGSVGKRRLPGWKTFRSPSLDAARKYAEEIFQRTGIVVAITDENAQRNPLTRLETANILRASRAELAASEWASQRYARTHRMGKAMAYADVAAQYGPRSSRQHAAIQRAKGAIFPKSNPPSGIRLPKPGTKMTVAQALDLAQRIGDRALIAQCQQAMKLQKKANKGAKCVIWKTFAMGSKNKIDSIVALTHYGDSPETMYKPPKGSKKGQHMYRHKWGEKGGKNSVPLLASADGKMLLMPLEGKKVASDWLRH